VCHLSGGGGHQFFGGIYWWFGCVYWWCGGIRWRLNKQHEKGSFI
jgi:hypothetical protein